MDIWLEPIEENKRKLMDVLKHHGINKQGLDFIEQLNFAQTNVFHLGDKPYQIDFLTQMAGLNFTDSISKAVYLNIADSKVPILQLEDLIVNKMLSNRMKDRADVEELQLIHKNKKE